MVIDRRRTNKKTMENRGFEPLTYRLRTYRWGPIAVSPSLAIFRFRWLILYLARDTVKGSVGHLLSSLAFLGHFSISESISEQGFGRESQR